MLVNHRQSQVPAEALHPLLSPPAPPSRDSVIVGSCLQLSVIGDPTSLQEGQHATSLRAHDYTGQDPEVASRICLSISIYKSCESLIHYAAAAVRSRSIWTTSRRRILPLPVFGIDSVTTTPPRSFLNADTRSATNCATCGTQSSSMVAQSEPGKAPCGLPPCEQW